MESLRDDDLGAGVDYRGAPLGKRAVGVEQRVRALRRRIEDGVGLNDSQRQNEPAAFLRKSPFDSHLPASLANARSGLRRIEAGSRLKKLTSFVSAAGARRISDARERVLAIEPPILIMAATRAAADEFALALAAEKGATFGVTRSSVAELVSRVALPALAKKGLTPTAPLSDEAVAARVADDLANRKALDYFTPVARMPGFPRALSRTLGDLRLADVAPDRLSGHAANDDLRALLERAIEERLKAGAVDYATLLHTATTELQANRQLLSDKTVVLLDIAIASKAEEAFAKAVIEASKSAIATIPAGDVRTLESLGVKAPVAPVAPGAPALSRLQAFLFSTQPPPSGSED